MHKNEINAKDSQMSPDILKEVFYAKYSSWPNDIIKSPGRINLIGEHTDYNNGYVLPAAIDYHITVAVSKNDLNKIRLYSIDYNESFSCELKKFKRTNKSWINLILGVIHQLLGKIGGVDLAFYGDIPRGAGVSSSAAICCGVTMALNELYGLNLSKWDIAIIAQKSEHKFALVQCGIMDQFACVFGLANHVFMLNCLTLDYQDSEINLSGHRFILIDSAVRHNLEDSDYNNRKKESHRALDLLKEMNLSIKSFQDVKIQHLASVKDKIENKFWKRAFHIISENKRVLDMQKVLQKSMYEVAGKLLNQSHNSLKEYYEVTCPETDYLVKELNKLSVVLGARQIGGGFGGCVLTLVKDTYKNTMLDTLEATYKNKFDLQLKKIHINISDGCHRIT